MVHRIDLAYTFSVDIYISGYLLEIVTNLVTEDVDDVVHYSYESQQMLDPQKETVRSKFASTILFVEDFLCRVRSTWSPKDREQPKLTYQVMHLYLFLLVEVLQN